MKRNYLGGVWVGFVLVSLGACSPADAPASSAKHANETPRAASDRIDMELKDAEVTDALRALSGTAHVNIFADPDVNEAGLVDVHVHSQPWEQVLSQIAFEHKLRVEKLDVRGSERASLWITKQSSPPAPVTIFRGDRIVAKFDEAQIRDAVKTLADVAKTKIVVDEDVQVAVTLHMRLPWDLALYHLAQKYSLRIVRAETEIRISHR